MTKWLDQRVEEIRERIENGTTPIHASTPGDVAYLLAKLDLAERVVDEARKAADIALREALATYDAGRKPSA